MRQSRPFLFFYILFFTIGLISLFIIDKGDIVIWVNQNLFSPSLNDFFKYVTYLGDGILLAIIGVACILFKYKYAIIIAFTSLFQLVLVHLNKRILFKRMMRPKAYFENLGVDLNLVEGISTHSYNSFPSGHTATAFSVFLIATLIIKNEKWGFPMLLIAILVGYSRIHLVQHFFVDVLFGSLIGVASVIMAVFLYEKQFNKYPKLEKGLLTNTSAKS